MRMDTAVAWSLYPRTYIAPRTTEPLVIDGDLTKTIWQQAPWSEPFADIQGSGAPDSSYTPALTRFKALWDDDYLYIGALLEASKDFVTAAHFTERNSPIYQQDSDFEVFVDALGCNHNYKELEINALNTVWNLLLDKPYNDGGEEHSGRVAKPFEPRYYEVGNQKSAVQLVSGRLNDPTGQGATWSVELALSHADHLARYRMPVVWPRIGTQWRINFSRVELQGEINWTWQPQTVWDPTVKRFAGKINMHLPDAWGYLVFGDESGHAPATEDPSWPLRLAAMNVFYALHYYKEQNDMYTNQLSELNIAYQVLAPFEITVDLPDENRFVVKVHSRDEPLVVTVGDDRLLTVSNTSESA